MKFGDIIEDISISKVLNTNPRIEHQVMYRVLDSIFTMHDAHKIINNTYYYKEYKDRDVLYIDDSIVKNLIIINELVYPRTLIKEFYRHKFSINVKFHAVFMSLSSIISFNKQYQEQQL